MKLDSAFIDKAMWAEASPDGTLLWTSSGSGSDLLAYDMSEIKAANAAPGGPRLKPVPRVGGRGTADRYHGRDVLQAQAVRAAVGNALPGLVDRSHRWIARLKIEKMVRGEFEGLDIVKALDGDLHWLITFLLAGGLLLIYGNTSALVHFERVKGNNKKKKI